MFFVTWPGLKYSSNYKTFIFDFSIFTRHYHLGGDVFSEYYILILYLKVSFDQPSLKPPDSEILFNLPISTKKIVHRVPRQFLKTLESMFLRVKHMGQP